MTALNLSLNVRVNWLVLTTPNASFASEEFYRKIRISVRALNNDLDEGLPLHPLEDQRERVRNWRQIYKNLE